MENYILCGELGWQEGMCRDYEEKGRCRLREWWWWRNYKKQQRESKTNTTSQSKPTPTQNPTPEPTNPETKQENQNSKPTPSTNDEPINNETPPQQDETQENAQKEEERLKKERKEQELNQQRGKTIITEINNALNQEPRLTNSELSSQYQNWETQINRLTDIQQINNFQERLLADIQAHRQNKKIHANYYFTHPNFRNHPRLIISCHYYSLSPPNQMSAV